MKQMHTFTYFISLIIILSLGCVSFLMLTGNHAAQIIIGIVTSVIYVSWGIFFHWINNDLHLKVVIEYVLMGIISSIILITVLQ